ncbi:MAG: DUF1761 domain-containing protein [Proteobacteria bacterium]|nr:DUF1761 domain-containing protein [Pseudomonadota bacterium]TDJ37199.1 MAG: DUF1761 domain-containing protein [Gammaproteobacteria bacterium]
MNLAYSLADINWLAVVVATVIAFAIGGLWYSKALFGSAWLEEVGLTEEAVKNANMPGLFGGTLVLQFLAVTALAALIGTDSSWQSGLYSGLLVGVFWVATAYGITYLFEQRSLRLFLINAGYNVVLFSIVGTILGAWH